MSSSFVDKLQIQRRNVEICRHQALTVLRGAQILEMAIRNKSDDEQLLHAASSAVQSAALVHANLHNRATGLDEKINEMTGGAK